MDGILSTIKKLLGVHEDYTHFDDDIIVHINSAFSVLFQMGIGPKNGFSIFGYDESWTDFLEEGVLLNLVKTYVYLKTRMSFDPPQTSSTKEAAEKILSEYEWRILIQKEGDW